MNRGKYNTKNNGKLQDQKFQIKKQFGVFERSIIKFNGDINSSNYQNANIALTKILEFHKYHFKLMNADSQIKLGCNKQEKNTCNTLFFWMTVVYKERFIKIILKALDKNKKLIKLFSKEVLCSVRSSATLKFENTSLLYFLMCINSTTQSLVKKILIHNKEIAFWITAEVLCSLRPKAAGTLENSSLLFFLIKQKKLLLDLLELNPKIAKMITQKALCALINPKQCIVGCDSALNELCSSRLGRIIFNKFLNLNSEIAQFITKQYLCPVIYKNFEMISDSNNDFVPTIIKIKCSLLYHLYAEIDSIELFNRLLNLNNNLGKLIDKNNLCNASCYFKEGESFETTSMIPLLGLLNKKNCKEGKKTLVNLLKINKYTAEEILKDRNILHAICRHKDGEYILEKLLFGNKVLTDIVKDDPSLLDLLFMFTPTIAKKISLRTNAYRIIDSKLQKCLKNMLLSGEDKILEQEFIITQASLATYYAENKFNEKDIQYNLWLINTSKKNHFNSFIKDFLRGSIFSNGKIFFSSYILDSFVYLKQSVTDNSYSKLSDENYKLILRNAFNEFHKCDIDNNFLNFISQLSKSNAQLTIELCEKYLSSVFFAKTGEDILNKSHINYMLTGNLLKGEFIKKLKEDVSRMSHQGLSVALIHFVKENFSVVYKESMYKIPMDYLGASLLNDSIIRVLNFTKQKYIFTLNLEFVVLPFKIKDKIFCVYYNATDELVFKDISCNPIEGLHTLKSNLKKALIKVNFNCSLAYTYLEQINNKQRESKNLLPIYEQKINIYSLMKILKFKNKNKNFCEHYRVKKITMDSNTALDYLLFKVTCFGKLYNPLFEVRRKADIYIEDIPKSMKDENSIKLLNDLKSSYLDFRK